MKPNGWIKLHRKLLSNEIYRFDKTALLIFLHLLLNADKNGRGTFGRKQLALQMGNNENTVYKALKRLSVTQMVTLTSNNRFTEYSICKWKEYQSDGNNQINTLVTTKEQPSNNQVTHYKNKEVRIKNTNIINNISTEDLVSKIYYEAIKSLKLPTLNHTTLKSKIKALKMEDTEPNIIWYLEFMRDNYAGADLEFKPQVNNALDIYNKRVQIINAVKSQIKSNNKPVIGVVR